MESKATPGPWHRNIKPARKYTTIFAGRNTHVAYVATQGLTDEEIEANSDLIVEGPAMREALIGARNALLKALPHVPPDQEGLYCGEWLTEINEVLGRLFGWVDGRPKVPSLDVPHEHKRSVAMPRVTVPADVRKAIERMCTPLDQSILKGATAEADARCMQIIKQFIDGVDDASPSSVLQPDDGTASIRMIG